MKNKLSPIEELRAERKALKLEVKMHEDRLKDNLMYAKHNWGTLLLSSVVSSSTNSVKSLFGFSSEGGDEEGHGHSSLLDKIISIAPLAWSILQPILLGMITKKVSSFFFGKKKKT